MPSRGSGRAIDLLAPGRLEQDAVDPLELDGLERALIAPGASAKTSPNERNRSIAVAKDQLRGDTYDGKAMPGEPLVPTCISSATSSVSMVASIHFDDQALRRSVEINDAAVEQDHLPAKPDAELSGAKPGC